MNFEYSPKTRELQKRLDAFMRENIYPNEKKYNEEIDAGDRWKPLDLITCNLSENSSEVSRTLLANLFSPGATNQDITTKK